MPRFSKLSWARVLGFFLASCVFIAGLGFYYLLFVDRILFIVFFGEMPSLAFDVIFSVAWLVCGPVALALLWSRRGKLPL